MRRYRVEHLQRIIAYKKTASPNEDHLKDVQDYLSSRKQSFEKKKSFSNF
jgi:hypothetical protein